MPGRHEAPGTSEFWQGLAIFATKIVVGLAVVFGLIFGVVKVLPSLFPSDDEPPVSITSLGDLETTTTSIDAAPAPDRTTSTTSGAVSSTTAVTPSSSAPSSTSSTPSTSSPSTSTTSSTTTSTTSTTTTTLAPRAPSEVTVKVLNSTTTSGLAAGLTSTLAGLGYLMEEQDNYRPTLSDTFIYYEAGYQAEAVAILEHVPGGVVAENPADVPSANVLVILGTSYSG